MLDVSSFLLLDIYLRGEGSHQVFKPQSGDQNGYILKATCNLM